MAVVPPGNKQIGSFGLVSLTSAKTTLVVESQLGLALVKDPNTYTPREPYNVSIGSFGIVGLSSAKKTVIVESVIGLAVVKYVPPTVLFVESAIGLAAVKNNDTTYSLALPLSVGIGSFGIVSLTKAKPTVLFNSVIGLAVVQNFVPRNESVIHSLNYGL